MRNPAPPLKLVGLRPAPSQVCGAFRLVPLLREHPCNDVRLTRWTTDAGYAAIPQGDATYRAFVPHGLRLDWGTAVETQISAKDSKSWRYLEHMPRLRRRDSQESLRFLPMHMAMEAMLRIGFAPPRVAWRELSEHFTRFGLGDRWEWAAPGHSVPDFEDALRTFELHRGQVGMLVFVAETLMSAFVVPSAEDYGRLHLSMLSDFYGDLIYHCAMSGYEAPQMVEPVEVVANPLASQPDQLAAIRAALGRVRENWAAFTASTMLGDWVDRNLRTQCVYRVDSLRLERFITELDPNLPNHMGERLVREDGEVLYLNTYRLSATQSKRVHLLQQLADHDWHFERAAAAMGTDVAGLVARLKARGFDFVLKHR